ncbi:NAD-dependent epimerase/dehydratase family protein [Marilutibacter penaei]|nr:NAD-dependent epimerase/dehydratase family protein [Lysobacter penaei]
MKRRDVIKAGLGVVAGLAMPAWAGKATANTPMRILVMGGTGFLGPHFVEAALSAGHRLTLFNRGRTNPERFSDPRYAEIEQLQGDRKTDLSALEGDQRWDVVLDTSAYLPADVTRSVTLLGPRVDRYLVVSTVSVNARNDIPDLDETGALIELPDPTVTEVNGETYGGLKALCEKAAEAAMPGRTTVVRPGLIVGPGDTTDRFTYWPARADRGGEILAPGSAADPTQFIDVRDLAAFLLHLLEQRTTGIFNADAPAGSLTMGDLLDASLAAAGTRATVTWVPAGFLEAQQVRPWADMPVWIPAQGEYAGFGRTRTVRAEEAGLRYRPLEATVGDTLAWWRAQPESRRTNLKAGLAPGREREVLDAWHTSSREG